MARESDSRIVLTLPGGRFPIHRKREAGSQFPVEQIMQSHPITIAKSEGLFQAIKKMREHGIKRLPVVDNDGSLFGVVSADDLLMLMAEEIGELAKICEIQVSNEKGVRLPAEKKVRLA